METNLNEEQLSQLLAEIREKIELHDQKHEYVAHDCADHKELRVRSFGGGNHYVYQCMECGEQRGQSLKKDAALALSNDKEPLSFDENIYPDKSKARQKIHELRRAMYTEEQSIQSLIRGWSFDNFESSNSKEQKKLEEANEKLAALLEDFEEEFGEEKVISSLVAQTVLRKKKLYRQRAEETDRFMSEKELKQWFKQHIEEDFDIYEEVSGVHLAENVNVRIDFVLYPKLHLIKEGFVEEPFGIEVKYFKQEGGFTHKTSRGIWQTISYNDCQFTLNGRQFKTKFCLLFSNLSFSSESALIKNLGHEWENDQIEWKGMLHVANHARVGTLSIKGDKTGLEGWGINFAGGAYFSRSAYNEEIKYRLSNVDMINKVRIGNF